MREHALRGKGLRSAAVLTLAGLFFTLAIGTALLESGIYRKTAADAAANTTRRTALSYLANQVRRADARGDIAVGDFGGKDALFLYENEYVTCLYCYEGMLRELYTEKGSGLSPSDGVAVLELSSLSITSSSGHLTFTATDKNGLSSVLTVSPRCGMEEAVAP
ncbi:MAG: DUF4860 domain-containing protein [Clostridiaceae bacterium]|nr:DUF4860 domain-containing protein [Clostridiaceae bacterium]